MSDEPGLIVFPGCPAAIVSIHVGPSSYMTCRRGGVSHRGSAVHGDIDIIPPFLTGTWELKERDTALIVRLEPALLNRAAEDLDAEPTRIEIRNRFQARDACLEHIAWALKAEMETGCPGGRLYMDSLATAMASQLVGSHSSLQRFSNFQGGFSTRKLKQVLSYIEDNLSEDLSLLTIAEVAGLSVSHCKVLFRKTVGIPVHQYVIRRRVDRAATLLRKGDLPVSQVALETGFSHQSHLAAHMKRVLGVSPRMLRK
ncbi:MAG TPA: AraC family transcriptional regulator [Terriglobales bacterium]|nr:AraC family transcriptional regulator [Terriglobales bacterium]